MRAKEHLRNNQRTISNYSIIQQIIDDLYNIRHDLETTKEYYERILLPDIRYDEWVVKHAVWRELHKKYGASALEPELVTFEGEINKDDATNIREDLLKVVREDKSFGYIFHLLSGEQDNLPNQREIEKAIYEDIKEELTVAKKRILELEKQLNESAKLPDTSGKNQLSSEQVEDGKRTMKVTTDVLIGILEKINVKKNDTVDATKISEFISYITGYSVNTIRQRLSNKEELTSSHRNEVEKVKQLLKILNIEMSITYNNQR